MEVMRLRIDEKFARRVENEGRGKNLLYASQKGAPQVRTRW